jgi:hypothetical protein
MTTTMFYVDALSPNRLDEIRRAGLDDAGNVLPPEREAEGGEPLRCCLRLAQRRERVLLIAYRPFDHAGPYAETGPLFIHGDRCAGYGEPTEYPEAFRNRPQVFRAYDTEGLIAGGVLAGAPDPPERIINEIFEDESVERIHTRNVVFGCYMLQIRRVS